MENMQIYDVNAVYASKTVAFRQTLVNRTSAHKITHKNNVRLYIPKFIII